MIRGSIGSFRAKREAISIVVTAPVIVSEKKNVKIIKTRKVLLFG
jgi:hypothetical protein